MKAYYHADIRIVTEIRVFRRALQLPCDWPLAVFK
jgi:hypothetical protein